MSEILYSANPPLFRNNPLLFALYILLIPVFGVGLLLLAVWYVSSKAKKLTITSEELHYEEGILSKSRADLRLSSIRSVRIEQSLFQRMFGTGDVNIYTAGDTPEVVVRGMPDPHRIRELT